MSRQSQRRRIQAALGRQRACPCGAAGRREREARTHTHQTHASYTRLFASPAVAREHPFRGGADVCANAVKLQRRPLRQRREDGIGREGVRRSDAAVVGGERVRGTDAQSAPVPCVLARTSTAGSSTVPRLVTLLATVLSAARRRRWALEEDTCGGRVACAHSGASLPPLRRARAM